MKINNKIKKFFGGNWCKHPRPYGKKHTNIPDDFGYEHPKPTHKKKKKKSNKNWYAPWSTCPFCKADLECTDEEKRFWRKSYEKYCECGAREVLNCPCCDRETWCKDNIYKHMWMGCGFVGEKLIRGKSAKEKKD